MLFFFLFLFLTLGSAAGTVPFVPLSTFEDFTYFDFSNVSPGNVPEDALKVTRITPFSASRRAFFS